MRDHYDFSKGTQGKQSDRYKEGTNMVLLDPDVAKEFPDDSSVNEALREFLREKKNSPDKPA
ncbi:MAG: hypothetical protein QGH93_10095 [Gammaproteobacteria bacterium]|jgi:hypothetical protein|nr:hypothetical protein [Chromatiales bacterium]MDP6675180.1 hypothetical protein [Gammaproteobacteria bacterium]